MLDSAVDAVPDDLPVTEFLKHDVGMEYNGYAVE
jgi:hypothetical protein